MSYKPLILHYITKWYVCVRIVLTFLKGCVHLWSEAHSTRKRTMILATNGIPEEKTKRELVFRCFIKKKKRKKGKEKIICVFSNCDVI